MASSKKFLRDGVVVAATKIGKKHQITIPKEIYSKMNLFVGDFIEFQVTDDHVRIMPKKLVSQEATWFYSKEWQKKEREADRDIATGKLSGPFNTSTDIRKHLQSLKKKKN